MRVLMIIKSTSEPFNFAAPVLWCAARCKFNFCCGFTLSARRRSLFLSAPDDKAVLISLALSQSNAYDVDCDYQLYIIIICVGIHIHPRGFFVGSRCRLENFRCLLLFVDIILYMRARPRWNSIQDACRDLIRYLDDWIWPRQMRVQRLNPFITSASGKGRAVSKQPNESLLNWKSCQWLSANLLLCIKIKKKLLQKHYFLSEFLISLFKIA